MYLLKMYGTSFKDVYGWPSRVRLVGSWCVVQGIDAIVLNEAQDCTAAMLDIFARVPRACWPSSC